MRIKLKCACGAELECDTSTISFGEVEWLMARTREWQEQHAGCIDKAKDPVAVQDGPPC